MLCMLISKYRPFCQHELPSHVAALPHACRCRGEQTPARPHWGGVCSAGVWLNFLCIVIVGVAVVGGVVVVGVLCGVCCCG